MKRRAQTQGTLFDLPERQLEPAPPSREVIELAAQLPPAIRLGAMTWSYPGWAGIVYAPPVADKLLAAHGLTAYGRHPLLRMAEIDRSYYEPLAPSQFASYARQVPDDFRFFVKAHEDCTVQRFPLHARYGDKRGRDNPRFLDAEYAERAVVEPTCEGLGQKLGGILFQFSPERFDEPRLFAQRLFTFLSALPRGPTYAVELRNRQLLTAEYGAALAAACAIHCHNAWRAMPSVLDQARVIPPAARRPLLVRWLLRQNDRFEDAEARYEPFSRIVSEDEETRATVAALAVRAHTHHVPAYLLVDNKAEGCAPESIVRLARALVDRLSNVP